MKIFFNLIFVFLVISPFLIYILVEILNIFRDKRKILDKENLPVFLWILLLSFYLFQVYNHWGEEFPHGPSECFPSQYGYSCD